MITFLALIGFFFLLSLYFGLVQQLDTLQAAWRLLMVTAAAIVVGQPVGRLMHRVAPRVLITGGLLVISGALFSLTGVATDTSFASIAWRLALLGLGIGTVLTPMTATAVASVPYQQAGMAAAGNNAFRQVGGALGPAVLGALLSTKALDTLPGHLTDAGVTGATQRSIVSTADSAGLGAVAHMNLGADTGRALGALSNSFLDGMRLCLVVAGSLTLLAALVCVLLLRRPQEAPSSTAAPVAGGNTAASGATAETPTAAVAAAVDRAPNR
jgi:predicted MFS family arabinose efflux permease